MIQHLESRVSDICPAVPGAWTFRNIFAKTKVAILKFKVHGLEFPIIHHGCRRGAPSRSPRRSGGVVGRHGFFARGATSPYGHRHDACGCVGSVRLSSHHQLPSCCFRHAAGGCGCSHGHRVGQHGGQTDRQALLEVWGSNDNRRPHGRAPAKHLLQEGRGWLRAWHGTTRWLTQLAVFGPRSASSRTTRPTSCTQVSASTSPPSRRTASSPRGTSDASIGHESWRFADHETRDAESSNLKHET